ncbi:MAG: pyrroloquinoline quinone biosynthesis peptide chaperone PqqD [Vulcanimicrobiaceae bacterium]
MTGTGAYRLARGVRLRRESDGSALLLVPEGIVTLNETAAAVLQLADGSRDVETIAEALAERFEATAETLEADVRDLLEDFVSRGYVVA